MHYYIIQNAIWERRYCQGNAERRAGWEGRRVRGQEGEDLGEKLREGIIGSGVKLKLAKVKKCRGEMQAPRRSFAHDDWAGQAQQAAYLL